jgi:predicted molibdopterin-dependent oxidoreductase YjgC
VFARLPEAGGSAVDIVVDGVTVAARSGDTVAAALLLADRLAFRTTPVGGTPRGPLCLMGVCYDCLVTIDGLPNRQACLVTVAPGMRIDTQRGARPLDAADGRPAHLPGQR